MPIFKIPYCFLSKPAGTSVLKVYVVVPLNADKSVTFNSPEVDGKSIQIDLAIADTGTETFPHDVYSFDLATAPWAGATTVEVSTSYFVGGVKVTKTSTFVIEDADDFAPAAGAVALDCPYLALTSKQSEPNKRYPKVLVPSLDNAYSLEGVPANPNTPAQESNVTLEELREPHAATVWTEPSDINNYSYNVPSGQLDDTYFFTQTVTPPNATAATKKPKSKQRSNHPVPQGGNAVRRSEGFLVDLLRRLGLLRAVL